MYIYNVRVKGDAVDLGKKIDWCVVIEQSAYMMPVDHYVVRGDMTWTGEAATLPSKPLVIELNGIVNVEGLKVTYGGEEFYRHIYDFTSPLVLDDCYTVYPDNATNQSVNMELEPGFEKQGTLVLRYGKWVFIPSSTCKGEIKVRITSAENQAYTGVHTMFCRVAVEEVRINKSARTNLLLGDVVSLWDYYDVYPDDADNKEMDIEYNHELGFIDIKPDTNEPMYTALGAGESPVTFTAADGFGASGTVTFTVKEPHFYFDVTSQCDHDLYVGDVLYKQRQHITDERTILIKPLPVGSQFDPSLIDVEIECDEMELPSGWVQYELEVISADDTEAVYSFTPMIPGQYKLTFTYDEGYLKDENLNRVGIYDIQASVGHQLQPGWNWVGVAPASDGMLLSDAIADKKAMIEARTQHYFLVNDETKGFVFGFPINETFFSHDFTLDRMIDNGHFRIRMRTDLDNFDGRIYPTGTFSVDTARWEIKKGWNWLVNPSIYEFDLTKINSSYYGFNTGDIIKSQNGVSTFGNDGWEGSLDMLLPGEGCALYATRDMTIQFDLSVYEQPETGNSRSSRGAEGRHWSPSATRTYDVMGVIAQVDGIDEADRYEVAAFVDAECRGIGKCVDGRWYLAVNADADETVRFMVYDAFSDVEQYADTVLEASAMAGTYTSPVKMRITDNDIRVSGAMVTGEFTSIHDLQGRNVTASNGHLAPGIYLVATPCTTAKIVIK